MARLELGDIDWRRGEVTIRGKGGRRDVLPLPVEVGEALAAYLREGRPLAHADVDVTLVDRTTTTRSSRFSTR